MEKQDFYEMLKVVLAKNSFHLYSNAVINDWIAIDIVAIKPPQALLIECAMTDRDVIDSLARLSSVDISSVELLSGLTFVEKIVALSPQARISKGLKLQAARRGISVIQTSSEFDQDEIEEKMGPYITIRLPIDIEALLSKIHDVEEHVFWIDEMLSSLYMDMELADRGYRIYYCVDFSELFRYLHPLLDDNRWVDIAIYYREQLATRLLFEWIPETLVLLPEYGDETIAHFEMVKRHVGGFKRKTVGEIIDFIDELKQAMKSRYGVRKKVYRKAVTEFYDLLSKKSMKKELVDAVNLFLGLIKANRLVPLQRLDAVTSYQVDENSPEFRRVFGDMFSRRPDFEMYDNNKTDARALIATKMLFESNIKHKNMFLLVSASKRIFPAFYKATVDFESEGTSRAIHLARNLNYIILKYYYHTFPTDEALQDINRTRMLFRQFSGLLAQIRSMSLKDLPPETRANLGRYYDDVRQQLQIFECFPYPLAIRIRKKISAMIEKEDMHKILSDISRTLEKPDELVKRVSDILASCEQAVESIRASAKAIKEVVA